jgi:hypothetical protein
MLKNSRKEVTFRDPPSSRNEKANLFPEDDAGNTPPPQRQMIVPIISETENDVPPTPSNSKEKMLQLTKKHLYIIGIFLFLLSVLFGALKIGVSSTIHENQHGHDRNLAPCEQSTPKPPATAPVTTASRTRSPETTATTSSTNTEPLPITSALTPPPPLNELYNFPINSDKTFTWRPRSDEWFVQVSSPRTVITMNRTEIEMWTQRFANCLDRGDPCLFTKSGPCSQTEPCNDYRLHALDIVPDPYNNICYDRVFVSDLPKLISICFDSNHWISYALLGVSRMKINRTELFAFYHLCKGALSARYGPSSVI